MGSEIHNGSVEFFDAQFQRQIHEREYALNPFETLALDYLKGAVLAQGPYQAFVLTIDRGQLAALRTVPLLSNPHSRHVRRAPRFSPTRSLD